MSADKPEVWGTAEVGAYLNVQPATVNRYHRRGDIPQPDGYINDGRNAWWLASTIRNHQRPGRGSGLKNWKAGN